MKKSTKSVGKRTRTPPTLFLNFFLRTLKNFGKDIFYATFLKKVAQKSPADKNFRALAIKASKI